MKIDRLDHLVLTVNDIEATCRFYSTVLGMEIVSFGSGRRALAFGHQKLNLHEVGREYLPHAEHPIPGSADLCFISAVPLASVLDHLHASAVPRGVFPATPFRLWLHLIYRCPSHPGLS